MRKVLFMILGLIVAKPATAAIKVDKVEYTHSGVVFEAYLAYDDAATGKHPGILVVHDWMGVSDNTKMHAEDLAKLGYIALTADIYGKGVRPANAQEAQVEATKYYKDRSLFRERARIALDFLASQKNVDTAHLAVIGYCFGGAGALELARSGAPLKGVVTFHGSLATPTPGDAKNIKAKVLVLHGADDPYVKQEDVTAFMNEMRNAGVDWQLVQYSGAVHAFTDKRAGNDNSKGAAYNAAADRRSWLAMKNFFQEIF
jgi:dienelactone hydrolase